MRAVAVIVGINDYKDQPLTSAVNDANEVKDVLVGLGSLAGSDVTLLTSESGAPTRRAIRKALHEVYKSGDKYDRLYFYFAGHGLLAPTDAARGLMHTAVVPSNVYDLRDDADNLIDVDELTRYFQFAGPQEQFFIIDACRDLAFGEDPPNLPTISWSAEHQDGNERAQAILYAVAPKGRAVGIKDGTGIMSQYLVQALRGIPAALDWSDDLQSHVVTPKSVHRYVEFMILKELTGKSLWQRNYMKPSFVPRGAESCALLQTRNPQHLDLKVLIEPPGAANDTKVWLTLRGNSLQKPQWPPHQNMEVVQVLPDRYGVQAQCSIAQAHIISEPENIDVRERSDVVVRVGLPGAAPSPGQPIEPAPGKAASRFARKLPDMTGLRFEAPLPADPTLMLGAAESLAVADVQGLDPPYTAWTADKLPWQLQLAPGTYRIRFRLGGEVFSQTTVELAHDQDVEVSASAAISPLINDTTGPGGPRSSVIISESMGPLQANIVPTMLAVLSIKPFDEFHDFARQFDAVVEPRSPAEFGSRVFSLVIAIEGATWPVAAENIGQMMSAEIVGTASGPIQLNPVRWNSTAAGLLLAGLTEAPSRPFSVRITSPYLGELTIASASLPGRATVMTAVLHADGAFQISQHILRFPGRAYPEPVPNISYSRMLRELQLGQQLYQAGELPSLGTAGRSRFLNDALNAKWTDPILGCMAYYALADEARISSDTRQMAQLRQRVASNLWRYFAELPDVQIIAGLEFPQHRPLIDELIGRGEIPVLARSLREAARKDRTSAVSANPIFRRIARRIPVVSKWSHKTGGPFNQMAARIDGDSPFTALYSAPAESSTLTRADSRHRQQNDEELWTY